jgi:hypothetical protein
LILTRTGKDTFQVPKDSTTMWCVDQIADENLMAADTSDRRHLIGYTWDRPADVMMTNCGNPCLHTGPGPSGDLAPGESYSWHGKIYLMANNWSRLMERYAVDQNRWKGRQAARP